MRINILFSEVIQNYFTINFYMAFVLNLMLKFRIFLRTNYAVVHYNAQYQIHYQQINFEVLLMHNNRP